jgi:hypothetical protein
VLDYVLISLGWDDVSELRSQTGLLFISLVIYEHEEPWWSDTARESLRTWRKTCPSATWSTNPTLTGPGANTGVRRERPATNRLGHDTAFW